MLTRPRSRAELILRADVPACPGVYAWFRNDECIYLGKASNLKSRLGTHLGTSLDLNRSTYRSWVAVRELGLAREYTRRRPSVLTEEQVAIVNAWVRGCELTWVTTKSKEDASLLEKRLLTDWRPPINVA